MVLYLLKSTACLTIFFLFYKGLLENTSMHRFKRFYLLGCLILSFLIPSIVFVQYVDMPVVETLQTSLPPSEPNTVISQPAKPISDWETINFPLLAWSVYGFGLSLFSIRFGKNLVDIVRRIRRNQKIKETSHIKVLIHEQLPPHTFLKYIFLEKEKFQSNALDSEVLLHEETHAMQRHTYDILFVEIIQLLLWFNPLVYLFKHSIKLNHEFLADEAVLRKLDSPKTYQNTLLSYLSAASQSKYQSITMASAIHYSSIKKRFTIMRKQTSKKVKLIRMLLILPLVSLLLLSFSETQYVPRLSNAPIISTDDVQQRIYIKINKGQITVNEKKVALNDFAKTLNQMTKGWEKIDYTTYRPDIQIWNTSEARLAEIDKEFKKTRLSKANGGMSIIPPNPPAPPAPPTPEELEEEESLENGSFTSPPPPPEPVHPLDHVIAMAKKGADFYFENRKISSKEAIDLLKKQKNLNIETKGQGSSKPQVRISKNPITISKTSNTIETTGFSIKTGTENVNGEQLFYTTSGGKTHYFNGLGQSVDATGKPLPEKDQNEPAFYYNEKVISSDEANKLLSSNTSIQVTSETSESGQSSVFLSNLLVMDSTNPNNTGGVVTLLLIFPMRWPRTHHSTSATIPSAPKKHTN
ncbi:MAG: M56 family metallopeptidase [Bacteroidota bacterium]